MPSLLTLKASTKEYPNDRPKRPCERLCNRESKGAGRADDSATCRDQTVNWFAHLERRDRNDPLFVEALDVIEEMLRKNREFHDDLRKLFRLQMAYLLLWSAIERYEGLRYHLGSRVMQKVMRIAEEAIFRNRVAALPDNGGLWVYRADDPGKKAQFIPSDPKKSLRYYYQIRSNMAHGVKRSTPISPECTKRWKNFCRSLERYWRMHSGLIRCGTEYEVEQY